MTAPSPRCQSGLGAGYAWLWTSSTVANAADGVYIAALPLLAAAVTRDPVAFVGVSVAGQLPWFLLALPAGVVVDRVDRRQLMGAVNIARMVVLTLAAAAVLLGWATLPLLYALAFILGAAETLYDNAAPAVLPALVRAQDLERANGRLLSAQVVANRFTGPPLGSALFVVAAAAPFFVGGMAYLASAVCLVAIRGAFRARPAEGSVRPVTLRAGIVEGLRVTFGHRLLRTLALILATMNAMWAATFALLALYALEVLALDELSFGFLLAAVGVGSAVGGIAAAPLVERIGRGGALRTCLLVFAIAYLAMGLTTNGLAAGALLALISFASMIWNVVSIALRQTIIPDHLFGRVFSAYRWIAMGAMPLGAALGGTIGRSFGLRAPWLAAGAVLAITFLAALPLLANTRIEATREEVL